MAKIHVIECGQNCIIWLGGSEKTFVFITRYFGGETEKVSAISLMHSSVYIEIVVVLWVIENILHKFLSKIISETSQTTIIDKNLQHFEQKSIIFSDISLPGLDNRACKK